MSVDKIFIMDILFSFSTRLKELLEENDLNAEKLGKLCNVNAVQLRRYLKGKDIRLSTFVRLADYFKCSLDYLAGRSDMYLDYVPQERPDFMTWLPNVIKENGKSTYTIFNETRIKSSYFTSWRYDGEPLLTSLAVLAEYLGCSLDRLVGIDR